MQYNALPHRGRATAATGNFVVFSENIAGNGIRRGPKRGAVAGDSQSAFGGPYMIAAQAKPPSGARRPTSRSTYRAPLFQFFFIPAK